MPPRNWKMRITDILDAIDAIQDFVKGMDLQAFSKDRKTVDAVLRNIAVIGEAARHIPPEIEAKFQNIPWADMRDMRNVVIHVYFGVNMEILWDTVQKDLPPLINPLKELSAGK